MKLYPIMCAVLLCTSCETVRTVYDDNGNVVNPDADPGGEKDLSAHFEKEFASSFSEKKNDLGIPVASSNKVSRYQRDLDGSNRSGNEYVTGSYAGADRQAQTMSFAGAGKTYDVSKAYSGDMARAVSKDLHPAFATASRGVYGSDDAYADNSRSAMEGAASLMNGKSYATTSSVYSRETTSGYVETRRDNTPPPRIMTRDQYYRKTVRETRALLGRDKEEEP